MGQACMEPRECNQRNLKPGWTALRRRWSRFSISLNPTKSLVFFLWDREFDAAIRKEPHPAGNQCLLKGILEVIFQHKILCWLNGYARSALRQNCTTYYYHASEILFLLEAVMRQRKGWRHGKLTLTHSLARWLRHLKPGSGPLVENGDEARWICKMTFSMENCCSNTTEGGKGKHSVERFFWGRNEEAKPSLPLLLLAIFIF